MDRKRRCAVLCKCVNRKLTSLISRFSFRFRSLRFTPRNRTRTLLSRDRKIPDRVASLSLTVVHVSAAHQLHNASRTRGNMIFLFVRCREFDELAAGTHDRARSTFAIVRKRSSPGVERGTVLNLFQCASDNGFLSDEKTKRPRPQLRPSSSRTCGSNVSATTRVRTRPTVSEVSRPPSGASRTFLRNARERGRFVLLYFLFVFTSPNANKSYETRRIRIVVIDNVFDKRSVRTYAVLFTLNYFAVAKRARVFQHRRRLRASARYATTRISFSGFLVRRSVRTSRDDKTVRFI